MLLDSCGVECAYTFRVLLILHVCMGRSRYRGRVWKRCQKKLVDTRKEAKIISTTRDYDLSVSLLTFIARNVSFALLRKYSRKLYELNDRAVLSVEP